MVILKHDSDSGLFDVFVDNTYIGYLRCWVYNKWLFEADLNKVPDSVLSEVDAILRTLNL